MSYLSEEQIEDIAENVKLIDINNINLDQQMVQDFDSKVKEYNDFLGLSKCYNDFNISKTHLLINKKDNEIIGYITLSNDTIRLSRKEKGVHGLENVPFISMPALKIGKLAINKNIKNPIKGYGSFLLEMARAYAFNINSSGVACRFLTVDADIEYNKDTIKFYEKNGFSINNRSEYKEQENRYKTISMRKDIFNNQQVQELHIEKAQ